MPYGEIKSERYSNLGGINTKVSRYITGPQQVIRLVNYDFSVPGSFTQRPDTSEFLGTSFGPYVHGLFEFVKTNGESYLLALSASNLFSVGSSGSYPLAPSFIADDGQILSMFTGSNTRMDVANFADVAWVANPFSAAFTVGELQARFFIRYSGYGADVSDAQPQPPPYNGGGIWYSPFSLTSGSSPILFATLGGWRYLSAYLTDRDTLGTANGPGRAFNLFNHGTTMVNFDIQDSLQNAKRNGISYLVIFREQIGYTAAALNTPAVSITTAVFQIPIGASINTFRDSGQGFTTDPAFSATYLLGATTGLRPNEFYPFCNAIVTGQTGTLISDVGFKQTGYPQYIAVYNNMAFYSGFFRFPSHVFWSQLGEPSHVANEDFSEVRTNNGDKVRAMINYNGQLIIGKQFSLHAVSGDDPDTVSFFDKTDEYGIMNNRACCVWNNNLWFLDGSGKGIGYYNGADTQIISDAVEDVFKRINLTAALEESFMIHVKSRNEVWCGVPVDGSPLVNAVVVYDYDAKSWATFEGLSPTAIAIARGTLNREALIIGTTLGTVRSLNTTTTGSEYVTTAVRFPFVTNFGWSTTQTYRRLYLDIDPVLGANHTFAARFYLDQSDTPSQTQMITTSQYQNRTDFGLPGKGLSVELIGGGTLPLRINGYTIESRFQRNV